MSINIFTTGVDLSAITPLGAEPNTFRIRYTLNGVPPGAWVEIMNMHPTIKGAREEAAVYILAPLAECTDAILRPKVEEAIAEVNVKYDDLCQEVAAAEEAARIAATTPTIQTIIDNFNK